MNKRLRTWDEVKAEIDAADPRSPEEKAAGRAAAKAAIDAYVLGYELSEMRKARRLTQTEVAERMGVSQARISKIENGDISGIEVLGAYISAVGGTMKITADFDDQTWRVA